MLFGRRGTGKSFLLRNMLYAMRRIFPYGVVFSRTETANSFFSDFVPKSYIYDEVYPEVIEELMRQQSQRRAQKDITRPDWQKDLWAFVVLDDCADQNMRFFKILDRYARFTAERLGRSKSLRRPG